MEHFEEYPHLEDRGDGWVPSDAEWEALEDALAELDARWARELDEQEAQ